MFESLPDSVSDTLEIMKLEPPPGGVVELDKQGRVEESSPHAETPASLLTEKCCFRDKLNSDP